MSMTAMNHEEEGHVMVDDAGNRSHRRLGRFLMVILAVAILAGAGAVCYYWLAHRPKARRRPPRPRATLVEVSRVHLCEEQIIVSAMGTVVPAKSIELASRVGGQVISVSPEFIPGGMFKAGDTLLRIDPQDYALAVRQRQAELQRRQAELEQRSAQITQCQTEIDKAQSNLTLELARQSVARREYELLGETIRSEDEALVLRKPQLKAAKATCAAAEAAKRSAEAGIKMTLASKAAAEAALDKAELDLNRTTIRAPFDAVIQSRFVELGSQVSPNQRLATLVGTSEFWVKVSVPVDELKWIHIPGFNAERGSRVRVRYDSAWGPEAFRLGTVKRLTTNLEPHGRMAVLLVSVKDPLDTKVEPSRRHPLLLGSYVRAEIEGRFLPNVVRIPRTALHEGENVWLMKSDRTLEIRPVRIAWSGNDYVLVNQGLKEGERLITSDLAAPVEGMLLRITGPVADSDADRRAAATGTVHPASGARR